MKTRAKEALRARRAPLVLAAAGVALFAVAGVTSRLAVAFRAGGAGAAFIFVAAALGRGASRRAVAAWKMGIFVAATVLGTVAGILLAVDERVLGGFVGGYFAALALAGAIDPSFGALLAGIRLATNADRAAVQALVAEILAEFELVYDRAGSDRTLEDIDAFYSRAGGRFWVVEEKGEIVATVAVRRKSAEVFELEKMYIRRAFRGKGLGKKLLEQAIQFARISGARRLELDTSSKLVAAFAMYEKRGFRPKPEIESARCDRAYFLEL